MTANTVVFWRWHISWHIPTDPLNIDRLTFRVMFDKTESLKQPKKKPRLIEFADYYCNHLLHMYMYIYCNYCFFPTYLLSSKHGEMTCRHHYLQNCSPSQMITSPYDWKMLSSEETPNKETKQVGELSLWFLPLIFISLNRRNVFSLSSLSIV